MTSFALDDDRVVAIIGAGAGGGTLAAELRAAGIDVAMLEAGPSLGSDLGGRKPDPHDRRPGAAPAPRIAQDLRQDHRSDPPDPVPQERAWL